MHETGQNVKKLIFEFTFSRQQPCYSQYSDTYGYSLHESECITVEVPPLMILLVHFIKKLHVIQKKRAKSQSVMLALFCWNKQLERERHQMS